MSRTSVRQYGLSLLSNLDEDFLPRHVFSSDKSAILHSGEVVRQACLVPTHGLGKIDLTEGPAAKIDESEQHPIVPRR
jgi:hypothetical protein